MTPAEKDVAYFAVRLWAEAAHAQSVKSGFYDNDPPKDFEHITARVMLAVCELSEATEELRKLPSDPTHTYASPSGKPEGFPVEIADAVIRIFDLCGWLGIDLAQAMAVKHAYNATRPRRHGKPGL